MPTSAYLSKSDLSKRKVGIVQIPLWFINCQLQMPFTNCKWQKSVAFPAFKSTQIIIKFLCKLNVCQRQTFKQSKRGREKDSETRRENMSSNTFQNAKYVLPSYLPNVKGKQTSRKPQPELTWHNVYVTFTFCALESENIFLLLSCHSHLTFKQIKCQASNLLEAQGKGSLTWKCGCPFPLFSLSAYIRTFPWVWQIFCACVEPEARPHSQPNRISLF